MNSKSKITIIEPYAESVEVEKVKSIYCPNDKAYITSDGLINIVWMQEEIRKAKKEVELYKSKYENIYRGLIYWKSRKMN